MAGIALLAAACSNECVNEPDEVMAPVKVQVEGFAISQEEMPATRGTAVESYTSVKMLTLAFYKSDGTESYKTTQLRDYASTYATFGEFSTSLPMGSYTMVVIGYCGTSPFTMTSATLATCNDERLQDTFVSTQAVNITSNAAMNLTAALDRVVSRLGVRSSDSRVAEATKMRMTFSAGARNFNPTTRFAATNTGFANTIAFSAAAGAITQSSSYLFLDTDEQTMDVTIETLDDADNVLFTKTVTDVPFKRNRMTLLTGNIFTAGSSVSAITVNSDWLDDYPLGF